MSQEKSSDSGSFGAFLLDSRRQAGFKSLDEAVEALASSDAKLELSRSMLSLYERNQVKNPNPEILRALAELYGQSYQDLAGRWFRERFGLKPPAADGRGFVQEAEASYCALQGPGEGREDQITIMSLDELRRQQEKLPSGSQVAVAAISFLDDNVFFEMVCRNLARKISYYYLLPEDEYVTYKAFVAQVAGKHPRLKNALDGKLTHFIPWPNRSFPVNYVLYILPSGQVQGFVGLLFGKRVQYVQQADPQLTWRILDGFRWAMVTAKDETLRKRAAELQYEMGSAQSFAEGRSLE